MYKLSLSIYLSMNFKSSLPNKVEASEHQWYMLNTVRTSPITRRTNNRARDAERERERERSSESEHRERREAKRKRKRNREGLRTLGRVT